ncbi:hypothetical protein [Lactobacillus huangpiensis]|uniref:hypothetical protein n=1 Tax=Lactobacillus huangpiensis TaxID=2799571 RepID=UPI001CC6F01D|nr:hypothetical protein [Lactobacillus huangpiensis]
MKINEIKNMVEKLDDITCYSGLITVYYKDQAVSNFTCGNSMQGQSDLIFNLLLQSQFKKDYLFERITSGIKDICYRKNPVEKINEDFDYIQLTDTFTHIGKYMNISKIESIEKELEDLNLSLKTLKKNDEILDYTLFVNYDNNTMYYESSFNNISEYSNLVFSFCCTYNLDPIKYLEAIEKKARTLRTHLLFRSADWRSQTNSLLLRLSTFGTYDCDRSLSEHKVEQDVIDVAQYIQNESYDWHCLFVGTRHTNFLSLTYSNYDDTFKGLKSLNQAIYTKYPEQLPGAIKFYNKFFENVKGEELNYFFYPSQKWDAFSNTVYLTKKNTVKEKKVLPIDSLIQEKINYSNIRCVFAEAANGPARLVRVSTDEKRSVSNYFIQLLGTLLSVYPDHIDDISNWSEVLKDQFGNPDSFNM